MEISYTEASKRVTSNLYNHMAWIVTDASPDVGDGERVQLDPKQHEKVLNLSQDLCAAVGGVPTPKQVGTTLHILKETRSKETVTLLNRLGNCISYNDAQRYLTTVAESVDEQVSRDGIFIPGHLKPGRFTQFAFDNLDFHEYTKDGRTLHGTTHIIFQYPDGNEEPTPVASVPLVKVRRSALKAPGAFQTKASGLSLKDRQRSRSLVGVDTVPKQPESLNEPLDHLSTLWHLVHLFPTDLLEGTEGTITAPTWSAFQNFLIPENTPATVIGYGPLFPQSPTNPDVVEKSVDYCMSVAVKMNQEFTIM